MSVSLSKTVFSVFILCFLTLGVVGSVYAEGLANLAHMNMKHQVSAEVSESVSSDNSYTLGLDDVIRVTVFGEDDLSGSYRIGSGGMISFPLIGEVGIRDKPTRQVEILLEQKLADGYLVDPNVSIEVTTYRPFFILGQVRNPGSYNFTNEANVLKAVATAGGFTYRANKKDVQILKTRNNESELYDSVSVDTAISPGDIILVKERFF